MFPGLSSLTGGGGLSSSESGDALSGIGGQTFNIGGIGRGSPLRPKLLDLDSAGGVVTVLALLAVAAYLFVRR